MSFSNTSVDCCCNAWTVCAEVKLRITSLEFKIDWRRRIDYSDFRKDSLHHSLCAEIVKFYCILLVHTIFTH